MFTFIFLFFYNSFAWIRPICIGSISLAKPYCIHKQFLENKNTFPQDLFKSPNYYKAIRFGIEKNDFSMLAWTLKRYRDFVMINLKDIDDFEDPSKSAQWILFYFLYEIQQIINEYSQYVPLSIQQNFRSLKIYYIQRYLHSLSSKNFFYSHPKTPYLKLDSQIVAYFAKQHENKYDFLLIPYFFQCVATQQKEMVEFILAHCPFYIFKTYKDVTILEYIHQIKKNDPEWRDTTNIVEFLKSKGAQEFHLKQSYGTMNYVQFKRLHTKH